MPELRSLKRHRRPREGTSRKSPEMRLDSMRLRQRVLPVPYGKATLPQIPARQSFPRRRQPAAHPVPIRQHRGSLNFKIQMN